MIERYDHTPAALYARVSSDRQDVDLSVAAQLRALRDYAEKNGYLVAREFIDEAESGRIADRPQFRKMIDEASRTTAPFKEILVWKFSRFTRKREHAVAFKSMLRRKGIRVVSITEHADDTPTGKLMEAIIESVDEFYSENLAQEVTRGMREAASTRLLGFQPCPLRLQQGHGARRSQKETHPGDQLGYVPHRQAHVRHGGGRKRDARNHPHPQQRGHLQSLGESSGPGPVSTTSSPTRRTRAHWSGARTPRTRAEPSPGGEGVPPHRHQGPVPTRWQAPELPRAQVQPPPQSRKLLPAQRPGQV